MEGRAKHPLLVLIHTVAPLVDEFTLLVSDMLPDVRVLHVLDEPLLARIADGAPSDFVEERLAGHVAEAEALGADAVLVTCSSVSLFVDAIRMHAEVPVMKIDEAMAREAVSIGGRIVILATNPTTLEPSVALLAAEAARTGRHVDLSTKLVEGALAALRAGDGERHDRLVEDAARDAALGADVVVLAQASMARMLRTMRGPRMEAPILASPYLALAQVGRTLRVDVARRTGAAPPEVGP